MKLNKLFVLSLICFVIFSHLSIYAEILSLKKILNKLTDPRATSLQKLGNIEKYKGHSVRGAGKIKDVIKGYGSGDEAIVYIRKPFRGKDYELVLEVDRQSIEKLSKGRVIVFEGIFSGMAFETLRFKNAKIIKGKNWWWPF